MSATAVTANNNVFLGSYAGKCATSGSSNIAIGNVAMSTGTISGTKNITIGESAGKTLSSGYQNIILGDCAGQCAGPYSNNVIIGSRAGCKICGASNFFGGYSAGRNATTANSNVFIGIHAGKCNTTGDKNIFIGGYSGGETGSITGACNIAIGRLTSLPDPTGSNQLVIGDGTNRWIAGDSSYNVTVAGIATVYSATGIVSATSFYGDGSNLTGISGGGGGSSGISTSSNQIAQQTYIGAGITNFNFVGAGITASITNTTTGNVFVPSAVRKTTRFVATANQTTFTGLNYTVGYVDVFLNGIKLDGQDEFTATNGTSVVLTDGATLNLSLIHI